MHTETNRNLTMEHYKFLKPVFGCNDAYHNGLTFKELLAIEGVQEKTFRKHMSEFDRHCRRKGFGKHEGETRKCIVSGYHGICRKQRSKTERGHHAEKLYWLNPDVVMEETVVEKSRYTELMETVQNNVQQLMTAQYVTIHTFNEKTGAAVKVNEALLARLKKLEEKDASLTKKITTIETELQELQKLREKAVGMNTFMKEAGEQINEWHQKIESQLSTIETQIPTTLHNLLVTPPLSEEIQRYLYQCCSHLSKS